MCGPPDDRTRPVERPEPKPNDGGVCARTHKAVLAEHHTTLTLTRYHTVTLLRQKYQRGTFRQGLGDRPVADKVQVKGWVNPEVKEAFEKFVVELHGQKYGYMSQELENALRFYTDKDRLAHIDDKLDRVLDRIEDTHTHKASETLAKVKRIAGRLHDTDRTVIPGDKVTRAIERGPGGDDRTVRKYKRQLKRQGKAYEHPSDSDVWTLDRDQWVKWAVEYINNNPTVTRMDVIEDYPIEYDDIERLAEEVLA